MIAAYKGTSIWPSRIIRFINWSEYSHVAWVTQVGTVIEAWPGGVREVPSISAQHTPGTVVDMFSAPSISVEQDEKIESFLRNQLTKAYDWHSVFHFITRRSETATSQEKWFCSELIFKACTQAGVELLSRVPAYKVHPGMLLMSPLLRFEETIITE